MMSNRDFPAQDACNNLLNQSVDFPDLHFSNAIVTGSEPTSLNGLAYVLLFLSFAILHTSVSLLLWGPNN